MIIPDDCIPHLCVGATRWDSLAKKYYGDPAQIHRIIAANPSIDITPLIPEMTEVYIPVIAATNSISKPELPEWMR